MCGMHAGYALLLSPNQTPYRDMYFLQKLAGLGEPDGVAINAVFTQLFFVMGLWPAIYAALLIPSARSATKAGRSFPLVFRVHAGPPLLLMHSLPLSLHACSPVVSIGCSQMHKVHRDTQWVRVVLAAD
jgi:hypothetical protein